MLDRVIMDIIDMPGEIVVVTQGMLPKPALPNSAFLFPKAAAGNRLAFTHAPGKS